MVYLLISSMPGLFIDFFSFHNSLPQISTRIVASGVSNVNIVTHGPSDKAPFLVVRHRATAVPR